MTNCQENCLSPHAKIQKINKPWGLIRGSTASKFPPTKLKCLFEFFFLSIAHAHSLPESLVKNHGGPLGLQLLNVSLHSLNSFQTGLY